MRKMNFQKLLTGTNDKLLGTCILLLRCTIGGILFVVGAGKVFGWFGGIGLEVTIQMFVTKAGIPAPLAYLSCFTEFVGGLLLILGLLTRPAAFAVTINMLVATIMTMPRGFIAFASYPFTLMIIAIVIMLTGPMFYSFDHLIANSGDRFKTDDNMIF